MANGFKTDGSFSYSEFVSQVKGGYGTINQNRFYVTMGLPKFTASSPSVRTMFSELVQRRMVHMLCKGVNIPSVSVASTEVRTTGEVINAPYDRNFAPATFTFYVDRRMLVRYYFDEWLNSIQNPSTRNIGWYSDFVVPEIKIHVLTKSEVPTVYTMTLYEAYPKSISNLSLDHANNDLMTLDVTFDFHYYTAEAMIDDELATEPGIVPGQVYAQKVNTANFGRRASATSQPFGVGGYNGIFSNYTSTLSSYANDFFGSQSIISGAVGVLNSTGIPIGSISNASNLRARAADIARGQVSNAISGIFGGNLGISGLRF